MLYASLSISNLDSSASLVEAYKLGSLAHGGFSNIYSDIDVGLLLNCTRRPPDGELIAEAKPGHSNTAKSSQSFGAIRNLPGDACQSSIGSIARSRRATAARSQAEFRRPTKHEIHQEQLREHREELEAEIAGAEPSYDSRTQRPQTLHPRHPVRRALDLHLG